MAGRSELGPLHRSRSPFVSTIISFFQVDAFNKRSDEEARATSTSATAPTTPAPSEEQAHWPGPFPPGMTADDVAELARADVADMERRAARQREIANRSIAPSRRSKSKAGSVLATLLLAPFFLPFAAATGLALGGSPIFMAIASNKLWVQTYARFSALGPADLWITIAIVLGGSLVAGFLAGLILSAILKPLKSFGLVLNCLIPLCACVPILVAAWFYSIPSLTQYAMPTWYGLFESIHYTARAAYAAATTMTSLSLVGAGWSCLVATIWRA